MIETKDLVRVFGDGTEINYSDMIFNSGETYVLLGASGCGKSTLLNMIAGVLSPTRGAIIIDGVDISTLSQKMRDEMRIRNIGYIFQDFKLIDDMTVEDNIRILELEGVDTSGMSDVLVKLGILALRRRRVTHLSGGEKQRVAIARALVKKPSIILADEPTGNLNFEIGLEAVRLMLEAGKGNTLIAVTHDDRLAGFFDHVIDMNAVASSKEVARNA